MEVVSLLNMSLVFGCDQKLFRLCFSWMGEFETVMQTQDVVEDLHNFREFSQAPSVKMRLCKHWKKGSIAFIW